MSDHDDDGKTVWLQPGQQVSVTLECNRCESYRYRAVNPQRAITRALRRLSAIDVDQLRDDQQEYVQEAVFFLTSAEDDAHHLAQHVKSEDPPHQRQDALDAQLADVARLAETIGCNDAADWIFNRLQEKDF